MSERSLMNHVLYRFLQRILQLIGVLVYHVRYTGWHNIPATGGVLVVSNHQSHLDPPLIGMGCPRMLNYVARKTLFRFAPFGWLLTALGALPIDRDGVGMGGIKESLKRLKRGEMVLIFPEGTRTRDGEMALFRPGFTTLAIRTKSAILPVAVEGAFAVWPRWRTLPGLGTVHIHFGVPLMPADFAGMDERDLLVEVERRVRECHAELRRHPAFQKRTSLADSMNACDRDSGNVPAR
jgi:1-acyl-sn-glycerol-3-phosphate acyltransferase